MKRVAILALCLAALALVALCPASAAAADDVPDFWAGPANGMAVYGWSGGQLTVPYVVAHVAQAEVDCTLVIYTMRGPTEMIVATVPMGTVTAAGKYFCNTDSGGELPFTFVWDGVTLDPGSYRCRVDAFDGIDWAVDDVWCYVEIKTAPDTTPPLGTTTSYDGLWRRPPFGVSFTVEDDANGWGGWGGLAHADYSLDGGLTWVRGNLIVPTRKRGGSSGIYTLLFRGTDAAGNEEQGTHSCQLYVDGRPPITTDDAPADPQGGDVTVHFAAADNMLGVTACSGVAGTHYRVDDERWATGTQVVVPATRNTGIHWIAYYSVDNAGNAENVKWCAVTIAAPGAGRPARSVPGRSHLSS